MKYQVGRDRIIALLVVLSYSRLSHFVQGAAKGICMLKGGYNSFHMSRLYPIAGYLKLFLLPTTTHRVLVIYT
jgi:hypothetical protein